MMESCRPEGGAGRVLVVDDHELFGQSITVALRLQGMQVHHAEEVGEAAVLAAADRLAPQVVLLDLQLGEAVALPLIAPLRQRGAAVVIVTGVTDRLRWAECLEAGAVSVVSKSDSLAELCDSVAEAAEDRSIHSHPQREALLAELSQQRLAEAERCRPFEHLTRRERGVLAALMAGKSADAIAGEQFVSTATVRSQIHTLLGKLGVRTSLGALALARDRMAPLVSGPGGLAARRGRCGQLKAWMMSKTAGPSSAMNRVGRMHRISGKVIDRHLHGLLLGALPPLRGPQRGHRKL